MDFVVLSKTVFVTDTATTIQCQIDILDDINDYECEDDEQFFILLTLASGSGNCEIPTPQIPVTIIDDGRALDRQSQCIHGENLNLSTIKIPISSVIL